MIFSSQFDEDVFFCHWLKKEKQHTIKTKISSAEHIGSLVLIVKFIFSNNIDGKILKIILRFQLLMFSTQHCQFSNKTNLIFKFCRNFFEINLKKHPTFLFFFFLATVSLVMKFS